MRSYSNIVNELNGPARNLVVFNTTARCPSVEDAISDLSAYTQAGRTRVSIAVCSSFSKSIVIVEARKYSG